MQALELGNISILNQVAMQTAYETGEEWLDKYLIHTEENIKFIDEYLKKNIPKVTMIQPEGMCLVWLDVRELKTTTKEQHQLFVEAGLGLNPGFWFGKEGDGFFRMNIGTTKAIIKEGLDKIKNVINK